MPTAKTSLPQSRAIEVFAWQGFSFEHPVDFAPLAITGTRREGYARLASAGKLNFQIRWKQTKKAGDLMPPLKEYLAKLERDAKKAKIQFRSEFDKTDGAITYRYTGVGQGRGKIFHNEACSRVFFLEVVGARKDALLPAFRELSATFSSEGDLKNERWSIFGLSFCVPGQMSIEKKTFQAGRTELILRGRHARIVATRWGFGNQLIQRHGFEPWARAALSLHDAPVEVQERGLAFTARGILRATYTLVKLDEAENQIVALQVSCRRPDWRPTWDWLAN